jgi:ATP-dependent Clp protease ATP-binding subunit ClpA
VTHWQEQGVENEEELTKALLSLPNAVTYAACLMRVSVTGLRELMGAVVSDGAPTLNAPSLRDGRNLTELARRGKLPPCIARDREIRMVAAILQRMNKNMPVLVGEPGVGKTAIAEGLAQYLCTEDAPAALRNSVVIEFPISLFTAGHGGVGEVQAFVRRVLDDLKRNPDVILFLDEFHSVLGAGRGEGQTEDVAQILKPALARAEIRMVGATTTDEYGLLEQDRAFERRMNPVRVEEPTPEQASEMLLGSRSRYEAHFLLQIDDDAMRAAVELSHRYLPHRRLPDKAFDLLDTTCGRLRTFTRAEAVTAEDVRQSIGTVMDRIVMSYGSVTERGRPLGVFLFHGPVGVGKTFLCRQLAATVLGDERRFLRLSMEEFSDDDAVVRLVGQPSASAWERSGILAGFMRESPFCVIELDSVEAAGRRVASLLATLTSGGRVHCGDGRSLDARNLVCVLSTTAVPENGDPLAVLPSELAAQVDDTVCFHALDREGLIRVAELALVPVRERLRELDGVSLDVDAEVLQALADAAVPAGTTRGLLRSLEREVLLPLAEMRLSGRLSEAERVRCVKDAEAVRLIVEG